MTRRAHRLRVVARQLRRIRALAALTAEMQWHDLDDDGDDPWAEEECHYCHGDGMDSGCDYLLPCPYCG